MSAVDMSTSNTMCLHTRHVRGTAYCTRIIVRAHACSLPNAKGQHCLTGNTLGSRPNTHTYIVQVVTRSVPNSIVVLRLNLNDEIINKNVKNGKCYKDDCYSVSQCQGSTVLFVNTF